MVAALKHILLWITQGSRYLQPTVELLDEIQIDVIRREYYELELLSPIREVHTFMYW